MPNVCGSYWNELDANNLSSEHPEGQVKGRPCVWYFKQIEASQRGSV